MTASAVKPEDDVISYCGSFGGETFASRRSKNTCNAKQLNVDILAKRLRDHSFGANLTAQPDEQESSERKHINGIFHGFRFMVVMFGGFALGMMSLTRQNISVAILEMVNQTALYINEHPDRTMDDFIAEGYSFGGEFDWDNEIQQMIMSWYMFAYALPQIPATKIGLMIGSRWAIFISLLTCAVATILTPIAAYWGWKWVIALRLLNGVGASAIWPMILNLIENWMPHSEISLGLTCTHLLGTVLVTAIPIFIGYLSSVHWSCAFYGAAIAVFVFCALWMILITDGPDDNWIISEKELAYIRGAKGSSNEDEHEDSKHKAITTNTFELSRNAEDESKPTVLDVLRVPSFYAYLILWSFYCSSYSGFSFIMPTYLGQMLKIEVLQNGFYCFIIQAGSLLCVIWPHPFLRLLESKFKLSHTAALRISYCIICSMVASTYIYIAACHDLQLPMLFINRCFHGSNDIVVVSTLMSNYAAAGLSSMAFSMVNTVGNLSVVFSSTFMGWLLDYTGQSRQGWSWIYAGLGVAQLIMLAFFTTLIRAGPINLSKTPTSNNQSNLERGKAHGKPDRAEAFSKEKNPVQLHNNFDKTGLTRIHEDRKI